MSEQKVKREAEPLFEIREYEAELFAPIEGRVEVKQERTAEAELLPDMSSMIEGIMEPMVMMLTLGMVMPVMQQAMVGVLQSTEVTVVVKPGSVVSVDITNSVLAVEVHGGNVNVVITSSNIALPIDVQAATIAMPVDIQAQTANLKVDITAQSIEFVKIQIAGQIGNVLIELAAQNVDVQISGFYQAVRGLAKKWLIMKNLWYMGEQEDLIDSPYTPAPSWRLVITNVKVSLGITAFAAGDIAPRYPSTGWSCKYQWKSDYVELYLIVNGVKAYGITASVNSPVSKEALPTPLVVTDSDELRIAALTNTPGTYVIVEVNGYEEPA